MQLENMYWYFSSALTNEICDKIIEIGEQGIASALESGESIDATTFSGNDKATKEKVNPDAVSMADLTVSELAEKGISMKEVIDRDVHVSWLYDRWINDLVLGYVMEANYRAGWNFDIDHTEPMQFGRYGINQFHGWHPDSSHKPYGAYWNVKSPPIGEPFQEVIIDGEVQYEPIIGLEAAQRAMMWHRDPNAAGKIRKLSVTVNLSDSDDYTGGNLRFDCGPHAEEKRFVTCEEIRPRGSIIVFPSHFFHQVTPITHGTRRSLVMWSLGPPFK